MPVLYPYERQAYILVRNPGGHSTSNGNSGSRGDGSKGGNSAVSTVPSDDSKGSYVSNGSASGGNGYVMGILQQRRHNIAEPLLSHLLILSYLSCSFPNSLCLTVILLSTAGEIISV